MAEQTETSSATALQALSFHLKAKPKTSLAELVLEFSLILLGVWLIARPGQSISTESPDRVFRVKQSIGGVAFYNELVTNSTVVVYPVFWTNWNLSVSNEIRLSNWRSYRLAKQQGHTSGGWKNTP